MTEPTPTKPPFVPVPVPPPAAFVDQARAMGVEFEPGEVERLAQFLGLLLHANESFNLTAITEPEQAWSRHILDAMSLVPALASIAEAEGELAEGAPSAPEASAATAHPTPVSDGRQTWAFQSERAREPGAAPMVIDIGSGGGVPALPLAIVMPEYRFTMVEATGKKAQYLDRTIQELGLKNAKVLNDRAENLGQMREHRERYDVATARALGHLAVVCELCGPLVRPGGIVIAVKGQKAEQELEESKRAMGWLGLRHVETLETPTGRLVILEKTTRTPRTYPRKVGEPSRVPLGVPRE